jgi:hypothetical protein
MSGHVRLEKLRSSKIRSSKTKQKQEKAAMGVASKRCHTSSIKIPSAQDIDYDEDNDTPACYKRFSQN